MARYVLLRIDDDAQAADLLTDMADYPDADLLTPSQEHQVHAEVINLPYDADNMAELTYELARSYAEYVTAAEE